MSIYLKGLEPNTWRYGYMCQEVFVENHCYYYWLNTPKGKIILVLKLWESKPTLSVFISKKIGNRQSNWYPLFKEPIPKGEIEAMQALCLDVLRSWCDSITNQLGNVVCVDNQSV